MPGLMAHKAIRPQADGLFLELVAADFLRIVLRHNPARSGGRGGVEGQKIRPGLMQPEADVVRIDDLDGLDLLFQFRSPGPFVALKAELHVLSGKGIAVVELHPLPQLKVVRQAVLRSRSTWWRGRGTWVVGHGFHQGIVHGVQKHIGRDDARASRPGQTRSAQW